jgi:imidazolonepropionase-like amidohydrolase
VPSGGAVASFVLTDARLLDGTGSRPLEGGELEIKDGKIAYCGVARRAAARPPGLVVVDVAGRTVMPGMIDCHIHMAADGGSSNSPEETTDTHAVLRAAADMRRTLEAGFTTVRDVGGRNYMEMDLKRSIGEGHVVGPRLLLAGKILSVTSTADDMFPGCMDEADSIPALRHGVRKQLKAGADLIKVMTTGFTPGVDPEQPQYTVEELMHVVEVAHTAGYRVAAHGQGIEGIRRSVEAGVDTVEHGCALVDDESVASQMARDGVVLVPTFSLYRPIMSTTMRADVPEYMTRMYQRFIERKADSLRCALQHDVMIAMGTDAGVPGAPHGTNAEELRLLVDAGMDPMAAIVATTSSAARALGIAGCTGSLEVGKDADVIVLDEDPLENVDALTHKASIHLVARQGRPLAGSLLERPKILSDLDEAAAALRDTEPLGSETAACCDHPVH